jgi:group I intron endonuclease
MAARANDTGTATLFGAPVFAIYKIVNLKTGAAYIGMTARGVEIRFKGHWKASKREDSILYRAMRKYGRKAFIVQTLAMSDCADDLPALEIKLIKEHGTFVEDGGYNMTRGGEGSPQICDEVRENMRRAARLRVADPEYRRKISSSLKGRKLSPEHIAASAKGRTGRPLSAAHRAKISERQKGKSNLTPEQCAKIAATLRGRPAPPQAIEAARIVNTGKKRSDETRRRISEALSRPATRKNKSETTKRRWAERRAAGYRNLSPGESEGQGAT